MRRAYVDTAHFIAVLLPNDRLHLQAMKALTELGTETAFVSSQPVLVELLAYFSGRGTRSRSAAVALVDEVCSDPAFTIIRQTPALFDEGFRLNRTRADKGYSLTDCMSMVICHQERITDVLTHDHHVEQEGLHTLL